MKSRIYLPGLISAICLTIPFVVAVRAAATNWAWQTDIIDRTVHVAHISLALDSSGYPHIAYSDTTYSGSNRIRYAYYDGTTWHTAYALGAFGECGGISLALDSSDLPHIAYVDIRKRSTALKYVHFDGERWLEGEAVDTAENWINHKKAIFLSPRSLALDPRNDLPNIGYVDGNIFSLLGIRYAGLKHAYLNGPDWEIRVVDQSNRYPGFDFDVANEPSPLILDSANRPHMVYSGFFKTVLGSPEAQLKYASKDNDYRTTVLDALPGWYQHFKFIDLAVDSEIELIRQVRHLSYSTSSSGLSYSSLSGQFGGGWAFYTSVINPDVTGEGNSIALDNDEHPHISYFDSVNTGLGYAHYDGTSWHHRTFPSEVGEGYRTSLAIDGESDSHISHFDDADNFLHYTRRCADDDGDGYCDRYGDNCPGAHNPTQWDTDQDGIGDSCDTCPSTASPFNGDTDSDGEGDVCDNCKYLANPGQEDTDNDGLGDACDNCVEIPNGPAGGTCMGGLNDGGPCDRFIDSPCDEVCSFRRVECEIACATNPLTFVACRSECRDDLNVCLEDCDCGTGGCSMAQEEHRRDGIGAVCDDPSGPPPPPTGLRIVDTIDPEGSLWYSESIALQCGDYCLSDLISLVWGGSTMELTLVKPGGDVYDSIRSSTPPITIAVPRGVLDANSGDWQMNVVAVDIPNPDYEFTLSVKGDYLYCPGDPFNDVDLDRVCGNIDNCPDLPNADQHDQDADGIGDVCDASDVLQANMDIKPDDCPNDVNAMDRGSKKSVLPLALLGTEAFDVQAVDPESLRLEGVELSRWSLEDVSGPGLDCTGSYGSPDGLVDLAVKFDLQRVVQTFGMAEDGDELPLTLTGQLKPEFGGTAIFATDRIIVRKQ